MNVAERLYLQGLISYPRTESTAYPSSFDVAALLRTQAEHPVWGEVAAEALRSGPVRSRAGVDAGDHPPITPCGERAACPAELHGDAARVHVRRRVALSLCGLRGRGSSSSFDRGGRERRTQ